MKKNKKAEANFFEVSWPLTAKSETMFFNGELFSGEGLAWLSSQRGQKLLDSIFGALEEAAGKGRSKLRLNFTPNSLEADGRDGWYFEYGNIKFVASCNPVDLVEIIEKKGFTIVDAVLTDDSCFLFVSW